MLTPAERQALKAKAHKLEPVVQIGTKGLTEQVIIEIDRALAAHALIKVRAGSFEREAREEIFQTVAEKAGAEAVQQVGKVCVLYRKIPDD